MLPRATSSMMMIGNFEHFGLCQCRAQGVGLGLAGGIKLPSLAADDEFV